MPPTQTPQSARRMRLPNFLRRHRTPAQPSFTVLRVSRPDLSYQASRPETLDEAIELLLGSRSQDAGEQPTSQTTLNRRRSSGDVELTGRGSTVPIEYASYERPRSQITLSRPISEESHYPIGSPNPTRPLRRRASDTAPNRFPAYSSTIVLPRHPLQAEQWRGEDVDTRTITLYGVRHPMSRRYLRNLSSDQLRYLGEYLYDEVWEEADRGAEMYRRVLETLERIDDILEDRGERVVLWQARAMGGNVDVGGSGEMMMATGSNSPTSTGRLSGRTEVEGVEGAGEAGLAELLGGSGPVVVTMRIEALIVRDR